MDKEKQHEEICELWDRYKDLARQVYSLQATLAELITDMQAAEEKLYKVYKASNNVLNGSAPEST